MNLQEMINNIGKTKEYTEIEKNEQKELSTILNEWKYNILLKYLNDNNLYTTGELKRLSDKELALLKMKIPNIPGVGAEKLNLFINKIDEIRNKRYINDTNSDFAINYGIVGEINKWHLEINHFKFNNKEYIDIRKIGPDKSKSDGISLDFEEAREVMLILKQYLEEEHEEKRTLLNKLFPSNGQNKITDRIIAASYEYGKKVINNEMSIETAINYLNSEFLMNKSSARMYIGCLISMVQGLVYTRKTSIPATEYFLNNIKKDFGTKTYELAIQSVKKHISWNRNFNPNDLIGLEKKINEIEKDYISSKYNN